MNKRTNIYWSIRRELWENRWLYIAPLVLAALIIAGFLFNLGNVAAKIRGLPILDPAKQVNAAVFPYGMAAAMLLFAGWIFGVFYSLDALNGERRDRSILFWKSMPVSDLETVAAKASIPLLVLPAIVCAVAIATQLLMLAISMAVMSSKGIDAQILWSRLPFLGMPAGMFYGMAVHALWYAPIFGYVLMVSAWARRSPFLWAFLPLFAAFAVETVAFGTGFVWQFLKYRLMGAMALAFKPNALNEPITQLSQLDPARFFASPGLWLGLAFAVAFLAAAIRLRRYRDPI